MTTLDELVDSIFQLETVWAGMHGRCNRQKARSYAEYGAKGIRLCPEWSGVQGKKNFVKWALENGYVRGESEDRRKTRPATVLDRKDGKKGYSPQNCRFVSQKQNSWNKENNRLLTMLGETKCVCEWGEDPRCRVHKYQFAQRITAGWDPVRAFQTPLRVWKAKAVS